MGNLFGVRRRAPEITAQDRAVLRLKQQRDRIKVYQKKTEAELAKNADLALQLFRSGMKDRAIIVMKRKKMMEDILNRTDSQLATLESMVADIEYTQIEVSVVEGLKVGTEALKQLNSLMNIDDIQQMMEDNAEAAEKQREISAILMQSTERYDESDLLKELEGYQAEATTAELDKLPNVPKDIEEEAIKEATENKETEIAESDGQPTLEPDVQVEDEEQKEAKKERRAKERDNRVTEKRERVLVAEQ